MQQVDSDDEYEVYRRQEKEARDFSNAEKQGALLEELAQHRSRMGLRMSNTSRERLNTQLEELDPEDARNALVFL